MNPALDGKNALVTINLTGFDPKTKGMRELVIPYLAKELAYAARHNYGKNARFLIEGSDEIKEMILTEVGKISGLDEFIFTDRNQVPAGFDKHEAVVTDPSNKITGLKNLYTQVPQEGDLPNFRALIKLSLNLARIEKLDTTDEDFRQFVDDLKIMLGWNEDVEIIDLRQAIQAAVEIIDKRFVFGMITKVPVNAALAVARLALVMTQQSA